ncbi:hypothetical protein SSP35_08_01090 [Streptomyces sp. NBRC 110611]|uniref:DUF2079 domain-containing protein n=1 Tax=Streptomyces sp. NBRC 110611 TaxID=1621259 RepID=UPI0008569CA2|nr:DUF2079 domain-containing protein [Streptomyces sp. NBRC 110611]GAU68615.1 hypothetical protein SSP35_08_01090 [Streptomyces sp. NBRC 110611]
MDTAAATAGGTPGTGPGADGGILPRSRTATPAATAAPAPRGALLAPLRARTASLRAPRLDPYWTAGFFFVAFALLALWRFRTLSTSSWDLGIFEQAIRGYAHFQAPIVDLKGPGTNILGDHFSPVLVLLAPFYRLFPSPLTLLIAQAALFALSTVPVTRAAARHLGRWPGLAIGIAYGMSWGVQKAVDFDFHEIAFALPLIAFALEAVLRGRWTAAVCWAAPLVLVKEDLGVTAAAIGALALLRTRRAGPLPIALVAFGLTASAVTLGVVIPAFNGSGSYDYWSKFGADGGGATIPLGTALNTTLWVLLPTTGLLALRSPLLLVALPTLGWRFLSHESHYWGTDWHYNAVLMPVVFLALVDALPRARASARPWLRSYAHHLPAAALAAALALTATLPLARLTETATYRTPPEAAAAAKLLERIPDGATVESGIRPLSRLTDRTRVFWMGDTGGLAPDYIADELRDDRTPKQALADAAARHPESSYALLGDSGNIVVLRRVAAR